MHWKVKAMYEQDPMKFNWYLSLWDDKQDRIDEQAAHSMDNSTSSNRFVPAGWRVYSNDTKADALR